MIELDGSYGEGGGSLIRTALALSTLTGKEFKVINIRKGRKQPGLKSQHLHAIKALKEICDAQTNHIELGSTELHFTPFKIKNGIYNIDIGTAGSIALLLQSMILPCMFAPGKVTLNINGGTCGKWQASVDYINNVLFPQIQRFVEKIELKVFKRGYFPKGGGLVKVEINPRFKLKNYDSLGALFEELHIKTSKIKLNNQGKLEQIRGVVNLSSELEEKEIGERISRSAKNILNKYEVPTNIRVEYSQTNSIGGSIDLFAIFSNNGKMDFDNPVILGEDGLIEKGVRSEEIGKKVAEKLAKEIESGFPVEKYLADQLIIFMGLIPNSEIKTNDITNHTKTNIYVIEHFLPIGFKISGNSISVEKI
jgi:RNA 3'-terminal phosphate cyclase (ATP)